MSTPLLTRAEARAMDADAVARLGLPTLLLMENAGRGAAEVAVRRFSDALGAVVVVGGPGQNGGDGWVLARHLHRQGIPVAALLVGMGPDGIRGDARINFDAMVRLGVPFEQVDDPDPTVLAERLERATLIVDGVFGTGLARPLAGLEAEVVRAMGASGRPVLALDLPSGIDADTGEVLGGAVHATATVTFGAWKRGLAQFPGTAHAGEVFVADIGIPAPHGAGATLIDRTRLATIPRRPADAHKGTAGHVLVVGGAPGTTGAALLAGRAALRAGAGLCTLAVPGASHASVEMRVLELMTTVWPASSDGWSAVCEGRRALVVGPGMGRDAVARSALERLAFGEPRPMVIDADGLTLLAELGLARLAGVDAPRVLTPHPGEAARLLGTTTAAVQADRFAAASALAERAGHVVILKGARSIVAAPGRPSAVNLEGTPALGTAGTGDVLAGMLGAMLSADAPFESACDAVVLHALAGEQAARGDRGLLASEVADAVPAVLASALGR